VFIFSMIFVTSTTLAITSYTIGEVIQKENIRNFMETEMLPNMINESCNNACSNFTDIGIRQICFDDCIIIYGSEINETINSITENIYAQGAYGLTLDQLSYFLNAYFIYFVLIAIATCILIPIIGRSLHKLGINFIYIAISCFFVSLAPKLITLPEDVHATKMAGYFYGAMYQQMLFGAIFVIAGIMLIIANKYFRLEK